MTSLLLSVDGLKQWQMLNVLLNGSILSILLLASPSAYCEPTGRLPGRAAVPAAYLPVRTLNYCVFPASRRCGVA